MVQRVVAARKVVGVVLGGVLLPLDEEDGSAPCWSFRGEQDGCSLCTGRKLCPTLPVPATLTHIGVEYLVDGVVW